MPEVQTEEIGEDTWSAARSSGTRRVSVSVSPSFSLAIRFPLTVYIASAWTSSKTSQRVCDRFAGGDRLSIQYFEGGDV